MVSDGELCAQRPPPDSLQKLRLTMQDFGCKYANSGLRPRPPTPPNAAHDQQEEIADLFEFGGLCDDDIEEMRPTIVEAP